MSDILAEKISGIPFRVIIYKILPFFFHEVQSDDEFGLFGYFLNDKSRKIFTIFRSIGITKIDQFDVVIDFSKLQTFFVFLIISEELKALSISKKLISMSPEFTDLESFTLATPKLGLSRILSINPNFPRLERFEIWTESVSPNEKICIPKISQFWNRLKYFQNAWCYLRDSEYYLLSNPKSSMKSLELLLRNEVGKILTIDLPALEDLTIRFDDYGSPNPSYDRIKVICQNLKSFGMSITNDFKSISLLKTIVTKNPHIDELRLELDRITDFDIDDQLDFIYQKKNLRELEINSINTNCCIWNENHHFRKNIEEIYISFTGNLADPHDMGTRLGFHFPKLKQLTFIEALIKDIRFPFCQNLTDLSIHSPIGFTGELFRLNNFRSLRRLRIDDGNNNLVGPLDGNNWNAFPELRSLQIYHINGFRDTDPFDEEDKFPKLEFLEFRNIDSESFTGQNWSATNTKRLRRMVTFSCESFKGCVFQQSRMFPMLEDLRFGVLSTWEHCRMLVGWNGMKKLRKLEISGFGNISELFEGDWNGGDELRFLRIGGEGVVLECSKWKVFEKVLCLELGDGVLGHPNEKEKLETFPSLRCKIRSVKNL